MSITLSKWNSKQFHNTSTTQNSSYMQSSQIQVSTSMITRKTRVWTNTCLLWTNQNTIKKHKTYIRKNPCMLRKQYRRVKVNKLHWTLQENILYKRFLEQNINLVQLDFHHRRVSKINVLISQYIKTKIFKQCRSHHPKMMINHKNETGILKFIEDLYNEHSPLQINLRRQVEGLQILIENYSAQQMNVEVMQGEGVDMVTTQPKIQQFWQITILTQNDISEKEIEANLLNSDPYNIQDYLRPNLWWDGS